ncbi:hypothetical protein PNQ92_14015 [Halobacterium salinarum]|uniref:hypothetical protein n=1 Tax=Halobacterium salinarum TaxID=2242 RepID=UPI0025571F9D|nr:hypothetical protein [Halobacterium salinarum]MDL0126509.1 hypothetical protein [Halobacterium salinarum]
MPYVGSSVDESTKEKWEQYIEDSHYGSMSELVRGAIENERLSDGGSSGNSSGQSVEVDRLKEQQQDTIQKIEELQEVVEEAQEEQEKTEYPEEVVEVAHDMANGFETIPAEEYQYLADERAKQIAKLSQEYFGDKDEMHKIEAALNYLEENISWIREEPTFPSEYYRVED